MLANNHASPTPLVKGLFTAIGDIISLEHRAKSVQRFLRLAMRPRNDYSKMQRFVFIVFCYSILALAYLPDARARDRMVQQGGSFGKRKDAPVSAVDAAERRRAARRPTFQNGKIFLETGVELTCAICNLGEGGCEISMRGVKTLPDEIMISVGMTQEPRKAQVMWRDQNTAGIEFLPIDAAEDGPPNNSVG